MGQVIRCFCCGSSYEERLERWFAIEMAYLEFVYHHDVEADMAINDDLATDQYLERIEAGEEGVER